MNWPTAQAPESVMLFLVDVFQYMFHTICIAASDTAELSGAFGCMLVASSPGAASTGKELNRMTWASGYLE